MVFPKLIFKEKAIWAPWWGPEKGSMGVMLIEQNKDHILGSYMCCYEAGQMGGIDMKIDAHLWPRVLT